MRSTPPPSIPFPHPQINKKHSNAIYAIIELFQPQFLYDIDFFQFKFNFNCYICLCHSGGLVDVVGGGAARQLDLRRLRTQRLRLFVVVAVLALHDARSAPRRLTAAATSAGAPTRLRLLPTPLCLFLQKKYFILEGQKKSDENGNLIILAFFIEWLQNYKIFECPKEIIYKGVNYSGPFFLQNVAEN